MNNQRTPPFPPVELVLPTVPELVVAPVAPVVAPVVDEPVESLPEVPLVVPLFIDELVVVPLPDMSLRVSVVLHAASATAITLPSSKVW
jgi:hypothetical protein